MSYIIYMKKYDMNINNNINKKTNDNENINNIDCISLTSDNAYDIFNKRYRLCMLFTLYRAWF
ncbi:hypothetical protein EMIT07CA2_550145 [Brevibacillus sp. IT-7CA2]